MAAKQIVAMGGGGFSMEPDNLLLDAYVYTLTGKTKPKATFIPTASYDSQQYGYRFLKHWKKLTRSVSILQMVDEGERPGFDAMRSGLLDQDVIYVGGGNTLNMIKLWRELGVDRILRECYENGIILAGISAGSLCWFEEGPTDSIPGRLTMMSCLGFLGGSNCVHYDGEAERRPTFQAMVAAGEAKPGIACDDGVAVHYVDGVLKRVVSSRPAARAYRVFAKDGKAFESELVPQYLGGHPDFLGKGARLPVIRRAVLDDAQAIHIAHDASIRAFTSKDYSDAQRAAWTASPFDDERRTNLERQIREEAVWVTEIGGVVRGYCHIRRLSGEPETAYLHALYLAPEAAGKGLGKRLVELAEEHARAENFAHLALHASKNAKPFYDKLGFTPVGDTLLHWVGGIPLQCQPMVKPLTR